MNRFKDISLFTFCFMAAIALSSLLLPAGIWLMLSASGALHPFAQAETYDRWFALDLGMLLCAFGVCTFPLGLPLVLRLLQIPQKVSQTLGAVFSNAWLLSAVALGLAGYGLWALHPSWAGLSREASGNTVRAVLFLLAGTGVRVGLEISVLRKRTQFGKIRLEPDVIKCAPGGEVSALLTMKKKAASIEAKLELCSDDENRDVERPVKVGPAELSPEGWQYRITGVLPEDVVLSGEDSWLLSVEARGSRGSKFYDTIGIELK